MADYKIIIARLEQFKREIPQLAGSEMVAHATDNLRADGFDGSPWSPPAPNGLILSGRGFRSVKFKVNGKVVTLEAEDYMVAHNEGAQIRGTFSVRGHSRKGRQVRAHSRNVNHKLPKRRFAGQSRQLDVRIATVLNKRLKRVFT